MNNINETITHGVATWLSREKIPHKDFAAAYGCPASYLSRILSGERNFDLDRLVIAAKALGYSQITLELSPRDKLTIE